MPTSTDTYTPLIGFGSERTVTIALNREPSIYTTTTSQPGKSSRIEHLSPNKQLKHKKNDNTIA